MDQTQPIWATLVSPEWSCVIEDREEEEMYIKVIRKEDLRML